MAISLGSNIALHKRQALDDRTLHEKLEDLVSYPENFLADMCYAFVKETGSFYIFNRENEITELGKWRKVETEGTKLSKELISSIDVGMIEDGTVYEADESLENVIRELLTGKIYTEGTLYYGTINSPLLTSLDELTLTTNPVVSLDSDNQYIVFATELSLGNLVIKDQFGDMTSDYIHTTMSVDGETYNIYTCKFKTTCNGYEYKLTFK